MLGLVSFTPHSPQHNMGNTVSPWSRPGCLSALPWQLGILSFIVSVSPLFSLRVSSIQVESGERNLLDFLTLIGISVSQLGKLISVEKLFLQELEQHANQLRAALANIEEYTNQVAEVYSQGEEDNIIGNPIHNFQLLKRVTVFWKNVQVTIFCINYWQTRQCQISLSIDD